MPSTFQAVAVVVDALLTGALYVGAFERQAGRYGVGRSDRALRFVGGSAVFLAVFAGPLYALHASFTDDVLAGRPLPLWLVAFPLAYVGVPLIAGSGSAAPTPTRREAVVRCRISRATRSLLGRFRRG